MSQSDGTLSDGTLSNSGSMMIEKRIQLFCLAVLCFVSTVKSTQCRGRWTRHKNLAVTLWLQMQCFPLNASLYPHQLNDSIMPHDFRESYATLFTFDYCYPFFFNPSTAPLFFLTLLMRVPHLIIILKIISILSKRFRKK